MLSPILWRGSAQPGGGPSVQGWTEAQPFMWLIQMIAEGVNPLRTKDCIFQSGKYGAFFVFARSEATWQSAVVVLEKDEKQIATLRSR